MRNNDLIRLQKNRSRYQKEIEAGKDVAVNRFLIDNINQEIENLRNKEVELCVEKLKSKLVLHLTNS